MNINNIEGFDKIINKKWDNDLHSEQWSECTEYIALISLRYCYGDKFKYLKHADAPDLQDEKNSIAIEVTEAVSPNEAKSINYFAKLDKCKNDKEKNICISKIQETGAILKSDEEMEWPWSNIDTQRNDIIIAIQHKLKKIQQYKSKGFQKLGLVVYYDKPSFFKNYLSLSECIVEAQRNSENKFDFIYILDFKGMFYYDSHTGRTDFFKLSENERLFIGNLARMVVEGEIKIRNDSI